MWSLMFKLTEREKKYTWREWADVLWIILRMIFKKGGPRYLLGYWRYRRWVWRETAKPVEQRHAEMSAIVARLEREKRGKDTT